jgi:hypothetical protein
MQIGMKELLASQKSVIVGYSNTCARVLTCSRESIQKWSVYRKYITPRLDWGSNKIPESGTCKLMIVIPVYKRDAHLNALLRNLSSQKNGLTNPDDVLITVSEMDEKPRHFNIAKRYGMIYHHIPAYFEVDGKRHDLAFNKSFAMNGAIWHNPHVIPQNVLFHDVDIIMGDGWLKSVLTQIDTLRKEKGSSWFCQTIKDRKVEYVEAEASSKVFDGSYVAEDLNSIQHTISEYWPERCPPGGSVMVPIELFSLSGGFDEFLFSGYSPEDSQFLQSCLRLLDPFGKTSIDNKYVIPLETEARSFHLYHPTSEFSNNDLTLLHLHHDTLNDFNFKYAFFIHTSYKLYQLRIPQDWAKRCTEIIPGIPDYNTMLFQSSTGEEYDKELKVIKKLNPAAGFYIEVFAYLKSQGGFYELFVNLNNMG